MKYLTLFVIVSGLTAFTMQPDFLSQQMKYARVKVAEKEKGALIAETLKKASLKVNDLNILFVSYKEELELELYVKSTKESKYRKLKTYEICARSGTAGPKRKQGDNQVPEGFYYIDRFNPSSSFYLSLGLNYPNLSDRKKSKAADLGGDIFIHGSCVTIGCMPMTDDKIKEIYLYAIHARQNKQMKIPVYIFPFRMNAENMVKFKKDYKANQEMSAFWDNLKTGSDKFHSNLQELNVKVDVKGDYRF